MSLAMTKELGAMETDEGAEHVHQGTDSPRGQSALQGSVPGHLVGEQDYHHRSERLQDRHGSRRRSPPGPLGRNLPVLHTLSVFSALVLYSYKLVLCSIYQKEVGN